MKNIVESLSNPKLSFELAEQKLNENLQKGPITEESFEKAIEGLNLLKGSKLNHKYLRKEGEHYIYADSEGKEFKSETALHSEVAEKDNSSIAYKSLEYKKSTNST